MTPTNATAEGAISADANAIASAIRWAAAVIGANIVLAGLSLNFAIRSLHP